MADTPFAPLVDQKLPEYPTTVSAPTRKYDNASSYQQPMNPVIPDELAQLESRIKQGGAGETSTLSWTMAILGAAKGDFRGLAGIEDAKRQTKIGKALAPEIRKINELTNKGEWEKATAYIDTLTGGMGPNAKEFIPYLTQMAANIADKQKGWNQLKAQYEFYKDTVPKDSVNYPVVEALRKAVERRDLWSEGMLNSTMARFAPHTQQIDREVNITSPMTGQTQRNTLPQLYKDKDFDNYTGIKTAYEAGLTIQQIADVMNGVVVKTAGGRTIEPNSQEAQLIKAKFIEAQPTMAREKILPNLPIEPALIAQQLTQNSPEDVAFRNTGKAGMESAISGQMGRLTEQKISEIKGTLEADPYRATTAGLTAIGIDPSDPSTYLIPQQPMAANEIRKSGKFREVKDDVLYKQIQPAYATIQGLDLIPEMLEGKEIQTVGDRVASGVAQRASNYLGFALGDDVETKQTARTILNKAINQAENIVLSMGAISGNDSKEIADYKAYASGDFTSNKDLLKNVAKIRSRLEQVIQRATGIDTKPKTAVDAVSAVVPTVADRNNNPLNIKRGEATEKYIKNGQATVGDAATDKGNFLKFNTPQDGMQAGIQLLTGPKYSKLTVGAAMKEWSGKNWYNDNIAKTTGISPTAVIKDLSLNQINTLTQAMAKNEGATKTATTSQVTRSPYSGPNISVPGDMDPAILQTIKDRSKKGTVLDNTKTIPTPNPNVPTMGQPALSAEERIADAFRKKQLQRIK